MTQTIDSRTWTGLDPRRSRTISLGRLLRIRLGYDFYRNVDLIQILIWKRSPLQVRVGEILWRWEFVFFPA